MSYNLLKFTNTYVEPGPRTWVVDSNEKIAQKLREYNEMKAAKETANGFQSGIPATELSLEEGENIPLGETEMMEESMEESAPEVSYQEMIEQAKAEIEAMRRDTEKALMQERDAVLEEAKKQGYEEGYREGEAAGKSEYEERLEALRRERESQEIEYRQLVEDFEPLMVSTINDLYANVFKTNLDSYKEIVTTLVSNALLHIESAKTYLVHVSGEDFSFVSMQKQELVNCVGGKATLDIVSDAALLAGQCLIETEGGVYDCGLDTQLSQLEKRLKILSYRQEE